MTKKPCSQGQPPSGIASILRALEGGLIPAVFCDRWVSA
jgi:hypothetical protein